MKRLLIWLTVTALLIVPQFASGSDLDDLKAVDAKAEKLMVSLDPNDIDEYVDLFDKDFIYNDPVLAFPSVNTKESVRQVRTDWVAQTEYSSWTPGKKMYRVYGTTGIVCKSGLSVVKLKGSPEVTNNYLFIITYAKIDGKWRACAVHLSKIPIVH